MNREDINKLEEKIANLTPEEKKQRDLYLKRIGPRPDVSKMADEDVEEIYKYMNPEEAIQGPTLKLDSIDKPWLFRHTDEAIMSDIPEDTIYEELMKSYETGKEPALNFFGIKTNKGDLIKKINAVAKSLKALGIKKGDYVIVNSVTLPQCVYLVYAARMIGAVVNTTDVRSDAETMKHYIAEGHSKFVFTLDSFYDKFSEILPQTDVEKVILLNPIDEVPFLFQVLSDAKEKKGMTQEEKEARKKAQDRVKEIKKLPNVIDYNSFIKLGYNEPDVELDQYDPNHITAIVHTSGTTGLPKSIGLTDRNFNSLSTQYRVSDFDFKPGDTMLNIIPMFTAYGLVNTLNMPLVLGMENIVYPKIVENDFMDIIRKYKPNHIIATPMHWEIMLHTIKPDDDLSFLKTAASGGDKLDPTIEKEINECLKSHGAVDEKGNPRKLVSGYGATEISGCALTDTNTTVIEGTTGFPQVKNDIKIVDPETMEEVQSGQIGEIVITSPSVMKEYVGNPEGTSKAIIDPNAQDRSYITGDLGRLDEYGNLIHEGRIKRLIIRKGFKVSAKALEETIINNEAIENCAVVGGPTDVVGEKEVPVAFIVLNENNTKNIDDIIQELRTACAENLPEFYMPASFKVVENLPFTTNNKVDFMKLKEIASGLDSYLDETIDVQTKNL